MHIRRITPAIVLATVTLSACTAPGSPTANPDHGPAVAANGVIRHPERPAGMPADFLFFNWHVEVDDRQGVPQQWPVHVLVNAISDAPVQGNVHGKYPFKIYTQTSYTHTIWYAPGVQVDTSIQATANAGLPAGWFVDCHASSSTTEDQFVPDLDSADDGCLLHFTVGG